MRPIDKFASIFGWALLAVSILGLAGCIAESLWLGAAVWVVVGSGSAWMLVRQKHRRDFSVKALIAAGAEHEHQDYLDGKESGVYGQFSPKEL